MGRGTTAAVGDATWPDAVVRDRVLQWLRLAGYTRGGRSIRLLGVADHGSHWLISFGVSSLEDPQHDFMHHWIAVERGTRWLYSFPSRARRPIDATDIRSVREGCTQVTPEALERLEAEAGWRGQGPTCFRCDSPDVHCDGGQAFLVAGIDGEFMRWVHICRSCGHRVDQWVSKPRNGTVWRCPHFDCEGVHRAG